MTNSELKAYVRQNYTPEEIFSTYVLEDFARDVLNFIDENEVYERYEIVPKYSNGRADLASELLSEMSIKQIYDAVTDGDLGYLEEFVAQAGMSLGAEVAVIEEHHDTNGHTGAITYCTDPLCQTYNF